MKNLRWVAILAFLLLLFPLGSSIKTYNHKIEVTIDKNNVGHVKETFRLGLDSNNYIRKYDAYETGIFKELSSQAGKNLSKWTEFHEDIRKSVITGVENVSISTSVRQKTNSVIVTYDTANLTELVKEKGRIRDYKVRMDVFRFYRGVPVLLSLIILIYG